MTPATARILAFLLLAVPLAADEVRLKNGDRLTGTVLDLAKGKLRIKTDHSGEVKVAWDQVVSLVTEKPVRVKLKDDETVRVGILRREEGGALIIQEEDAPDPFEARPEEVVFFNEPPVVWHGNISVAGRRTRGNTDNGSFLATGELSRKGKAADILIKGTFQYADLNGFISERSLYGLSKFDYRFWEGLYAFVSEEVLADRFKNLRARTITSGGLGYDILKEDWITFSGEVGLAYIYNNFRDETLKKDDGNVGGRASAELELKLPLGFEFKDTFTYYPNFDDTGDWQLRNEATLQKAMGGVLGGNWTLTAGAITEMDNEPPLGNKDYDVTYFVGLGFKF